MSDDTPSTEEPPEQTVAQSWAPRIADAQKQGISSGEILYHIMQEEPTAKQALSLGYKPQDIAKEFGLDLGAPKGYKPDYANYAKKGGLDPQYVPLLRAIGMQESSENPNAVGQVQKNGTVALGHFGLLDKTAAAKGVNPFDPEDAGPFAAGLLDSALRKYSGDVDMALKEYYGGPDQKIWGARTAAYPAQVKKWFGHGIPSDSVKPVQEGDSPNLAALKDINSKYAPSVPGIVGTGQAPEPGSDYSGPWDALKSGMGSMGFGPELAGVAAGGEGMLADIQKGMPIADAWSKHFGSGGNLDNRGENTSENRANFLKEEDAKDAQFHPLLNPGLKLGGSLVPTIALTALTGGAGDAALARLAPAAGRLLPGAETGVNGLRDLLMGRTGTNAAVNAPRNAMGLPVAEPGWAGTAGRAASRITNSGLSGAEASALDSHLGTGSTGEQSEIGGAVGAGMGLVSPRVGKVLNPIVSHFLPQVPDRATSLLAQNAIVRDGIPLTTKQIAGEAGASPYTKAQVTAWHKSLWDSVIPTNEQEAYQRITQGFPRDQRPDFANLSKPNLDALGDIAGAKMDKAISIMPQGIGMPSVGNLARGIPPDPIFSDFNNIARNINNIADKNEQASAKALYDRVIGPLQSGKGYEGKDYQELTNKGSVIANALKSPSGTIKGIAQDLRKTLDDALFRAAQANGQPEVTDLITQGRSQWRNLQVLRDYAKTAEGNLGIGEPGTLQSILRQNNHFPKVGTGDLTEPAQIGQRFLSRAPQGVRDFIPRAGDFANPWRLPLTGDVGIAGAAHLASTIPNMGIPAALAMGVVGAGAAGRLATNNSTYRDMLIRRGVGGPWAPNAFGGRGILQQIISAKLNQVGNGGQ